jgi:tRNA U55 pseudouridine synthase TruB
MSFLLRLSVGQFRLEDSTTLEEIRIGKDSGNPLDDRIQPKEAALDGLPRIAVSEEQAVKIRHGQPLWLPVDGIASQGTAWTFDDITSRDTVWTSNSIASRNTVWTSSGIASRDTVWTSDGIASWDTVWTSSGIASQNTAWTSDGITNRDTVWTSDDKQRLVALGHMTAGDGSRDGQALFRPDKVFSV